MDATTTLTDAALKDSGNDLIACRGTSIRAVQVKTTTNDVPPWPSNNRLYHLLAVVRLRGSGDELFLDHTDIFLVPKPAIAGLARTWVALENFRLDVAQVEAAFA